METNKKIEKWRSRNKIKPLIKVYAQGNEAERKAAEEALLDIGNRKAMLLIGALGSPDICMYAAKIIGMIGDPQTIHAVIQMLGSSAWNVRMIAAEALGNIGNAMAVKPLLDALYDNESRVGMSAAEALVKMGKPLSDADMRRSGDFIDRLYEMKKLEK